MFDSILNVLLQVTDSLPGSGLIMCQKSRTWYVATTFQQADVFCNPKDVLSFKNIPDITVLSDLISKLHM